MARERKSIGRIFLSPEAERAYMARERMLDLLDMCPKYFSGFYYGVDAFGQVGKRYNA